MADELGISSQLYGQYETGKKKPVTTFFLKWKQKFGIDLLTGGVDLKNQVYKCDIRKGKQHREVLRTIKTIALPFWEEVLEDSNPEDYVFSKGLRPGPIQIRADQITKRWYKYVKKPLGITADFYSLKHVNSSEMVDILSEHDAAKLMGHTTTGMVRKIYDTKREDRQHTRIKDVGNKF